MQIQLSSSSEQKIRVAQLLTLALLTGATAFTVVAGVALSGAGQVPASSVMVLRVVCIGLIGASLLGAIGFRISVRRISARSGATEPDELVGRYFSITILSGALMEGGALFAAVNHILSGESIDLGIAAVPLLILLVVFFPTMGRFEEFVHAIREGQQFDQ